MPIDINVSGKVNTNISGVMTSCRRPLYAFLVAAVVGCGGGGGSDGTSTPGSAPAGGTGSIRVAWDPPQTRADGSPLTNLAGFRIYYGTSSQNYSQVVSVNGATTTSYTIENLPAGSYYLVLKSVDASSNESAATAEFSKTIQ
jgi:hypothetical protein